MVSAPAVDTQMHPVFEDVSVQDNSPPRSQAGSRPRSRSTTVGEAPQTNVIGMRRLLPSGGHDEHRAWAKKVWGRFDRDSSGYVDKSEMDCEEFRTIAKSLIVPASGGATGGVTYARVQMNTDQALSFYFRKADINGDGRISFEEFENFTRFLRLEEHDLNYTANMVFALFDLDNDHRINREEFKEIYRFYLGHHPIEKEFAEEWGRLDYYSAGRVTREQYIRWLQTSRNPIFRQHAAPLSESPVGEAQPTAFVAQPLIRGSPGSPSRSLSVMRRRASAPAARPRWNQRFIEATSEHNDEVPPYSRHYFSKPQTMTELTRFYKARHGFSDNLQRVMKKEPPKLRSVVSASTMPMIASRHVPGGKMRHPDTGRRTQWNDHWQDAAQLKDRYQPGTLGFRCPGDPPRHLYADLYDDEV